MPINNKFINKVEDSEKPLVNPGSLPNLELPTPDQVLAWLEALSLEP